MWRNNEKIVNILLVEDNPADTRLMKEIFKDFEIKSRLKVCRDGVEAIEFLTDDNYQSIFLPNLIILDINLPRKSGLSILNEIKSDPKLKEIPVIVLATSNIKEEVLEVYKSHANCYITKPVDYNNYKSVLNNVKDFWLNIVTLPG
jgi:CheY-like chemotaxis protein